MNKKLIIGLLAVVLLGALAWLALRKEGQTDTMAMPDANFAVKDTANVDKVFIAQKSGKTTTLVRTPEGWRVNDRFFVNKVQMDLILDAIHDVKVKRPVGKAERTTVLQSIAGKHAKVEVYRNGQRAKTYYVGTETNDALGTYYLMEGSENPYVAYIPGFDGILNVRFNFTEKEFRDRAIFASVVGRLKEIKVEFPGKPDSSVTVKGQGNFYYVEGIKVPDTLRLISFVKAFERVTYSDFRKDLAPESADSLVNMIKPMVIITVTDSLTSRSGKLSIWADSRTAEYATGYIHETKDLVTLYMPQVSAIVRNREQFLSPRARLGKGR